MALKKTYEDIKDRIRSEVTEIDTINLFNNQFANEDQERTIKYPCILIEFSLIEWENYSEGNITGPIEITFHVGELQQKNEDLTVLELREKIIKAFVNWSGTNTGSFGGFEEFQDTEHDRVLDWQITFKAEIIDKSADRRQDLVPAFAEACIFGEIDGKIVPFNPLDLNPDIYFNLRDSELFTDFPGTVPAKNTQAIGEVKSIVGPNFSQNNQEWKPVLNNPKLGLEVEDKLLETAGFNFNLNEFSVVWFGRFHENEEPERPEEMFTLSFGSTKVISFRRALQTVPSVANALVFNVTGPSGQNEVRTEKKVSSMEFRICIATFNVSLPRNEALKIYDNGVLQTTLDQETSPLSIFSATNMKVFLNGGFIDEILQISSGTEGIAQGFLLIPSVVNQSEVNKLTAWYFKDYLKTIQ